ncbi:MAG TPA: hypothetical protein VN329_08875 [Roseomonas sp.]|nr:hypothetical protein [Roseomonas sp.]
MTRSTARGAGASAAPSTSCQRRIDGPRRISATSRVGAWAAALRALAEDYDRRIMAAVAAPAIA